LRERTEDILPLVDFLLAVQPQVQEVGSRHRPETRRLLLAHNWPGNVRELKNSIERAMILEDELILRRLYAIRRRRGSPRRLTAFEHSTSPAMAANRCPTVACFPALYSRGGHR